MYNNYNPNQYAGLSPELQQALRLRQQQQQSSPMQPLGGGQYNPMPTPIPTGMQGLHPSQYNPMPTPMPTGMQGFQPSQYGGMQPTAPSGPPMQQNITGNPFQPNDMMHYMGWYMNHPTYLNPYYHEQASQQGYGADVKPRNFWDIFTGNYNPSNDAGD